MIVIVNGAFGVGKSTLVQTLQNQLPLCAIFDPEDIGFVLRRLPQWIPLSTKKLDDYQDAVQWRWLTIQLAAWRARHTPLLLIPICFTNLSYLNEVRSGLQAHGHTVRHFCLIASEESILTRLAQRGVDPATAEGRWIYPRALAACRAHNHPAFGEQIETDNRSPAQIAHAVVALLGQASTHAKDKTKEKTDAE